MIRCSWAGHKVRCEKSNTSAVCVSGSWVQGVKLYNARCRHISSFKWLSSHFFKYCVRNLQCIHPIWEGERKKKNKQKSKCIVVYWEINYLKEMRFQGTDEMNVAMMLQPYCFSIAFFRLWSPCDTSSPSLPLCGNTELRVNDWVNCGVPIGTLVVVGMTGVVHCRRRWEVRCMKEWEAREL